MKKEITVKGKPITCEKDVWKSELKEWHTSENDPFTYPLSDREIEELIHYMKIYGFCDEEENIVLTSKKEGILFLAHFDQYFEKDFNEKLILVLAKSERGKKYENKRKI